MRTKASNEFEKDFHKLKNNSVFGRTMMNVRKFNNFELVTDLKRLKKIQTALPSIELVTIVLNQIMKN